MLIESQATVYEKFQLILEMNLVNFKIIDYFFKKFFQNYDKNESNSDNYICVLKSQKSAIISEEEIDWKVHDLMIPIKSMNIAVKELAKTVSQLHGAGQLKENLSAN